MNLLYSYISANFLNIWVTVSFSGMIQFHVVIKHLSLNLKVRAYMGHLQIDLDGPIASKLILEK
jgi:hypothetical protein